MSEATYGVIRQCRYEDNHYEHRYRKALKSMDAEGKDILMGCFFQILPMVRSVPVTPLNTCFK